MQSKVFSINKTLNLGGKLMDFASPKVMGILNVTPDSFFDGGKFISEKPLLEHVAKMLAEGADFIDVGGASTRPGAPEISEAEELKRAIPAIATIRKRFPDANISIDTFRAEVARQAVSEGACLVNDVSGGELDIEMFGTLAELKVPYVLMHMRGTPATMSKLTTYENVMLDTISYLQSKIERLHDLGLADIIVDPGFGFAKTPEQNFLLLQHLDHYAILGKPVLAGLSRKAMIWKSLDTTPDGALNGTTSLNMLALQKGASILRVHDVKEAVETVKLFQMSQQSDPQ